MSDLVYLYIVYQTVQFTFSLWPQCFLWDICLKWEVSLQPPGSGRPGVVLSSSDRLYSGPHYDAAALPMDLPGAKVTVLSQSIQSHDLAYYPNGFWLLRCNMICHAFIHLIVCACIGTWWWIDYLLCGAYLPLLDLVGLSGLEDSCQKLWLKFSVWHEEGDWGERGDWLLAQVRGLDTRGTGAKGEHKAFLIHHSVLAQIVWDGSCWWLLFPDRPCLFINELRHWFVVLSSWLCLGPV